VPVSRNIEELRSLEQRLMVANNIVASQQHFSPSDIAALTIFVLHSHRRILDIALETLPCRQSKSESSDSAPA
jgi:hypothetical protein